MILAVVERSHGRFDVGRTPSRASKCMNKTAAYSRRSYHLEERRCQELEDTILEQPRCIFTIIISMFLAIGERSRWCVDAACGAQAYALFWTKLPPLKPTHGHRIVHNDDGNVDVVRISRILQRSVNAEQSTRQDNISLGERIVVSWTQT